MSILMSVLSMGASEPATLREKGQARRAGFFRVDEVPRRDGQSNQDSEFAGD
jgi:hypothetical protein